MVYGEDFVDITCSYSVCLWAVFDTYVRGQRFIAAQTAAETSRMKKIDESTAWEPMNRYVTT
jgi:hypothetical protein